jgi:hypothetical protein
MISIFMGRSVIRDVVAEGEEGEEKQSEQLLVGCSREQTRGSKI